MRDQYMRHGQAFFLIFSITSRSSFDEIPTFYNQVLKTKDTEKIYAVLIGNKVDLESERFICLLYSFFKSIFF